MTFWRNKEVPVAEKVEEKNEVVVAVRDIQEYLVDEYEKVKTLKRRLEDKESTIERLRETELKYHATLVTLDEFDRRLKENEKVMENLVSKVEHKDYEIRNVSDELNTHKILLNRAKVSESQTTEKARNETLLEILGEVEKIKGQISKVRIVQLLKSLQ